MVIYFSKPQGKRNQYIEMHKSQTTLLPQHLEIMIYSLLLRCPPFHYPKFQVMGRSESRANYCISAGCLPSSQPLSSNILQRKEWRHDKGFSCLPSLHHRSHPVRSPSLMQHQLTGENFLCNQMYLMNSGNDHISRLDSNTFYTNPM